MKKKKIRIYWACGFVTGHEHRYKWTAYLCGRIQKFLHEVVEKKDEIFKIGGNCFSYYFEKGMEDADEGCKCGKDINKCGQYFICYMPSFIKEEYELHAEKRRI